jgi:hypothetical protein
MNQEKVQVEDARRVVDSATFVAVNTDPADYKTAELDREGGVASFYFYYNFGYYYPAFTYYAYTYSYAPYYYWNYGGYYYNCYRLWW